MRFSSFSIDQMPDGIRLTRSAKPGVAVIARVLACCILFLLSSIIFGNVIARHLGQSGVEIYVMIALSAVVCIVCMAAFLYATFQVLALIAGSEEWHARVNVISHSIRIGKWTHTQRLTRSALIIRSTRCWWRSSGRVSHELFANVEREWPLIWKHHSIMKSNHAEEIQDLATLISCFTGWIIVRERPALCLQGYEFSSARAEREFD